ncbi:MAG: Sec-independent protein translocase protein TatB [Candidatus Accumulibacter sp.]|jgi:sec-independent protein translocase protein TatB|nr:Sec-independent protein translocase protein TatB [Accumulibacter sp.]
MFEVSVSELMVLAIVGLIVVGPERLPKAARTAGFFLGRLRRYVNEVKTDIEREMRLDELKKARTEIEDSLRHFGNDIDAEFRQIKRSLDESTEPLRAAFESPSSEVNGEGGAGENSEAPPAFETRLSEVEKNVANTKAAKRDAP